MKKILSIILVIISSVVFSQNFGDFRTKATATAAWTTAGNWERWDGSAWVAQGTAPFTAANYPATYPGATNSSYAAYISTTNMVIPTSPTNSFGDLVITGKLSVNATTTLKTTNIIIDGSAALLDLIGNITLSLPAGSGFILKNGGKLDVATTCTGNQYINIGGVNYAQCNGTSPNFTEVNTAGGTLTSAPTANPNPAEPGQTVTLTGLATGMYSTGATYSWTGTGPNGFTFGPSSTQSPTFVPQYIGTYTFTLTVTGSNGSTDTQSIFVEVGGCPTNAFEIANNTVATFHAGAMRSSNGKWYAWGENSGGASGSPAPATNVLEVSTTNYSRVPAGATVKYVSGGSGGDGNNELVALVDNVYHTDFRIVSLSDVDAVLPTAAKTINLPLDASGNQILTKDVTSFYAGNNQIAIVANGRAYVYLYNSGSTTLGFGDNGVTSTATTDKWGAAVRTSTGSIITDFVSVRGDSESSDANVFIGLTLSGKVYTWGKSIPLNGSYGSRNYATDVTPTPALTTAKPTLVGANYYTGNSTVAASLYTMFDNGEFWAMGGNEQKQLGDFTITNRNSWVRVKETNSPLKYANIKYFTTEEHDGAGTPYNVGYVEMILSDNRLFSFGDNQEGLLGINQTLSGTFDPSLAYYQTNDPPTSNDSSQIPVSLNGSTQERTVVGVEAGGHISFITKNSATGLVMSIAGHGSNGSLLGVNNSESFDLYSFAITVPFPTCFIAPTSTACYKSANTTTGTASNVTHGITALQRAAKDNTDTSVWPLKLKGAYTALDAKTKGFVINRMPSAPTTNKGEPVDGTGTAVITAPVKGMAFYDLTNNCISINTDGTRTGWKCFKTAACDQ